MKKFEYKTFGSETLDDQTIKKMNKLGEEGWELVNFSSDTVVTPLKNVLTWYQFIFKREIES